MGKGNTIIVFFGILFWICGYGYSIITDAMFIKFTGITQFTYLNWFLSSFPMTVTFWFFISGTIGIFYLMKNRDKIFGKKIKEMNGDVIEFYYSKILEGLGILVSAAFIAISILWTLAVRSSYLQVQSLLLMAFFIYIVLSLYHIILKDFRDKFTTYVAPRV